MPSRISAPASAAMAGPYDRFPEIGTKSPPHKTETYRNRAVLEQRTLVLFLSYYAASSLDAADLGEAPRQPTQALTATEAR